MLEPQTPPPQQNTSNKPLYAVIFGVTAVVILGVILFIVIPLFQPEDYWEMPPAGQPSADGGDVVCIQVITPAQNPLTGEVRDFPTPCDVPEGWEPLRGGASSGMIVGENAITVLDQPPGDVVVVSMVALKKAGWVVIHKDANGAPGQIIGASRFEAGTGTGTVGLFEPMEARKVYYAMLHADSGIELFNPAEDTPLTDENDNILMMPFTATPGAELPPEISF